MMILLSESAVVLLLLYVNEGGSASLPGDVHIHLHHGEARQVGDNFLGIKYGVVVLNKSSNM